MHARTDTVVKSVSQSNHDQPSFGSAAETTKLSILETSSTTNGNVLNENSVLNELSIMNGTSVNTNRIDTIRDNFISVISSHDAHKGKSWDISRIIDAVDNLVELIEQIDVKNRDNKAVLYQSFHQQLAGLEKKMEVKLNALRNELIETANKKHLEMFDFTPEPGFVIKSKKKSLTKKEKVFINVFQHPCIEFDPVEFLKRGSNKIYLLIHDRVVSRDRDGNPIDLFQVCVSSEYFRVPYVRSEIRISDDRSIHQLINIINARFGEDIDRESYTFLKAHNGYKGDMIPRMSIPVDYKASHSPEAHATSFRISDAPDDISDISMFSVNDQMRSSFDIKDAKDTLLQHEKDVGVVRRVSLNSVDPSDRMMDSRSSSGGIATLSKGKHQLQRKSFFGSTQDMGYTQGTIAGRNMLINPMMLEYIREECLESRDAAALKEESVLNPAVLLGYQVSVDMKQHTPTPEQPQLYVITGARKNFRQQTEFRLSKFHSEDVWVRLNRKAPPLGATEKAPINNGVYDFRPLRKVLYGLEDSF